MCCTGILVLFLSKRRDLAFVSIVNFSTLANMQTYCANFTNMQNDFFHDFLQVVPTVILCLVCLGLCASSAILTWLKVLAPMSQYYFCVYRQREEQCRCYIVEESDKTSNVQNITALWPVEGKVIEFFCDA